MVITGITSDNDQPMNLPKIASPVERSRPSIELSLSVSLLLDHICEVTGTTKAGIISGALLDALPSLLARADALKKRHTEIAQAAAQKRK
jgi:hypothetical protein